jgi:hypothetical protein
VRLLLDMDTRERRERVGATAGRHFGYAKGGVRGESDAFGNTKLTRLSKHLKKSMEHETDET